MSFLSFKFNIDYYPKSTSTSKEGKQDYKGLFIYYIKKIQTKYLKNWITYYKFVISYFERILANF